MAFIGIGALLGGGFLGAVVDFGVTMAASIGISYAAQALAGKPKPTPTEISHFSTQGTIQASGDTPRSFIFGKAMTAGQLVYGNTWGTSDDGKSPNAYLTQVIKLSDLPIKSLTGIWIGGEKCTLGALDAEKGYGITEYYKDGKDHVWVKFYDGTQTVSDGFLVSKVADSDRPYETSRVGIGCAYAIATALVDDTLFTGLPQFKFEVSGIKLYDPTKDSTNGGSGSHRFSDPSTWGGDGDDFPAVQAYNLLRGIRYDGTWIYGLQKTVQANLPAVNWNAQIAKCRATITGVGGNEATYRSGGQVLVSATPADMLDALMTSCQGKISEVGGYYKVHLGTPDSATFSFTDDDLLSSEEQTYDPFASLADSINGITATYPDPSQAWNTVSAPSLYDPDYEAQDGDRRLLASPAFDLVPYAAQVQRLMRSALFAARRERKHTVSFPPPFWSMEPGDVCEWTSTRNGYDGKLFEVTAIVDKANLDIGASLQEVDPTDYDWDHNADYTAPTVGPTTFPRPEPQGVLDWAAEGYTLVDADGFARRPAIQLSWDGDVPGVVGVQYEVRITSDNTVVSRGRTDQLAAGAIIITQSLLPLTAYEVRGQYIPTAPRDMLWSDWISVTTPDVRFSLTDLDAAVKAQITAVQQRIQDVVDSTQALISSIASNQDARNWLDKQQVRSQLMARAGSLSASIDHIEEVAVDGVAALAQTVDTLSVTVGENTASITTTQTAVGDITGQLALSYSVKLDDNGYIVGYEQTNGGPGTGTTIFTTDFFQIAAPGVSGGAAVPIFTVGNVSGAAKIAFRGDMYIDGSVNTQTIAAGAITTVKLAAGAVTAGTIQAGAINTTQLAVNSVDINVLIAGAATQRTIVAISAPGGANIGSQTVTILSGSAQCSISGTFATGGPPSATLTLYVDGSPVITYTYLDPTSATYSWVVTGLSAGQHTFVWVNGGLVINGAQSVVVDLRR